MKKFISYTLLILMLVLLFTGCQQEKTGNQEDLTLLKNENVVLTEKIDVLTNRVNDLERSKEIVLGLIDEQVTILSSELNNDDYTILPIYHRDINTGEVRVQYYTMLPRDLALEQKIEQLSEKLSSYSFDELPIELLRIESVEGKKVAVINLMDTEERVKTMNRRTWAGNYFQGSSGGSQTSDKLRRTFLQENYKGEWIDGVRFLYNNSETDRFEHVGELLEKIYYRN